ncbi:allophanate hydrolase [Kineococcus radiotolerans]|uniref:Allophanate hydrolase n=1 Tax=Kineococcus radiotolerans (strain ATCC BAA-149 / DSM 14245 / SRS30216) TaxID=266940 RepID=A6W6F4_KINRD|nr:allophanate hydrolase [Kineococcus radiotolerans]ABS02393.1 Allophanate hydrolase [Kineococcus radiotolerans SRS30216 = ATCC BAA-149]
MNLQQVVRDAYARIAAADRPEVWIALRPEAEVLAEAAGVDPAAPLAGILVAVKDNIDVAGLPTTAGAPSFAYRPAVDATAVARLRAAGALVLGKTNLDQFATGLVGTRSPHGAVRHAFAPDRISGGSSSGSAVAVALGLVDVALGTDTAGSGRVPAALHGIVGVKPTRGLVPATGVVPACRSLDCVTVFARDLDLARRTAELLTGPDGLDPLAREDVPRPAPPARPRIAVPGPEHLDGLAAGWAEAFAAHVERVRATGAEVVEVDVAPLLAVAELLYGGAFVAERTAAVGRHVAEHADLVGTDLDPVVAGIVLAGERVSAVEVFRDRERLDVLAARSREVLAGFDALLTPTTTAHPTLAEVAADPVGVNSRLGRFTNFANLLDLASLAVPAGTVAGLPFGVMLTGPAFSDRALAVLAARWADPGVDLLVVGAHLSGQPLNHELVAAGGSLVGPARTAARYRLFALDTVPPKPGAVRVAGDDPAGASIAGEVWRLPAAGFGTFVAALPPPMTIGAVTLDDGRVVRGFLAEPVALAGAEEITTFGSWPAARAARGPAQRGVVAASAR